MESKENVRLKKIPLREKKFAQTRISLKEALLEKLKSQTLEEVSVKELCEEVQISEGTFFNYFPEKKDLLVYYVQIWSIEMVVHIATKTKKIKGKNVLEEIFQKTAHEMKENPRVMAEILAFQGQTKSPIKIKQITTAEKLMLFPEHPNVEEIASEGIRPIIVNALKESIETGELPAHTDIQKATF